MIPECWILLRGGDTVHATARQRIPERWSQDVQMKSPVSILHTVTEGTLYLNPPFAGEPSHLSESELGDQTLKCTFTKKNKQGKQNH